MMVNEDFNKFNKVQQEHEGEYLGTGQKQPHGLNDSNYNNQEITDKSPGPAGRDLKG